jgi:hypothetical protein
MPKPSSFTPPVIVDRAYQLWLWLEGRVTDFPTVVRHQLGKRILDTALDIMNELLIATYSPGQSLKRLQALQSSNQRIAFLRMLLRGARECHHISIDQHEHVAGRVAEIGAMVGAWIKKAQTRNYTADDRANEEFPA